MWREGWEERVDPKRHCPSCDAGCVWACDLIGYLTGFVQRLLPHSVSPQVRVCGWIPFHFSECTQPMLCRRTCHKGNALKNVPRCGSGSCPSLFPAGERVRRRRRHPGARRPRLEPPDLQHLLLPGLQGAHAEQRQAQVRVPGEIRVGLFLIRSGSSELRIGSLQGEGPGEL